MDIHEPLEKPSDTRIVEFVADSRIRALLQKPREGFSWRNNVASAAAITAQPASPVEPWLVANPGPIEVASHLGLELLARAFEELGTNPSDPRILGFANRYGWLGHPSGVANVLRMSGAGAASVGGGANTGEPRSAWDMESSAFADLRKLWAATEELSQARDSDTNASEAVRQLDERIRWKKGTFVYLRKVVGTDGVMLDVYVEFENPEVLRRIPDRDYVAAGRFLVAREINQRLQGHVDLVLSGSHEGEMRVMPDCLLSAVYLRFANEVAARTPRPRRRQCLNCGTSFDGRPNRLYHNDACKEQAAYMRKKARMARR